MCLPRGCRVPRFWAVLDCPSRPQAGSWMGCGAAGIRTGAHMGSRCVQGKDFSQYAITPGPMGWFLSRGFLLEETAAVREEGRGL